MGIVNYGLEFEEYSYKREAGQLKVLTLRQTLIRSDMSIEERLKEMIIKQLGDGEKPVTLDTSFVNDLGADSLDIVELVMELEDAFDLSIPDEDAEKIQTVGDAVKYISEHTQKNSA